MLSTNLSWIIICCCLNNQLTTEIFFPKNFIAQDFQIRLFVVVNADENHAIVLEQIASKFQTRIHKCQPRRMGTRTALFHLQNFFNTFRFDAKFFFKIFFIKIKAIVIDEVVGACVIRRINVDAFYLTFVRMTQMLEHFQVIARKVKIFAFFIFLCLVVSFVRSNNRFRIKRVK